MNKSQLQQMRNKDITQVDRSALVNICNIHIDDSLPATVKARIYFDQVINPYCFRCGDTPVRVRFVAEERTLKESLRSYFSSLKYLVRILSLAEICGYRIKMVE